MSLNMSLLYEESARRTMTQAFYGLNKNLRSAEGEFFDMKNLTSDEAPVMAVRERRYVPDWAAAHPTDVITGVAASQLTEGNVCWIDGTKLRIGIGNTVELSDFGFVESDVNRRIVKLGAYLIIIPDMIYVNTVNAEDKGVISDAFEDAESTFVLTVCDHEGGAALGGKPEKPKSGDLWLSDDKETKLMRYDKDSDTWYEIESFVKIEAYRSYSDENGYPVTDVTEFSLKKDLNNGDAIRISDLDPVINGVKTVQKTITKVNWNGNSVTSGIIVKGIMNEVERTIEATNKPVTIERVIPKLDHICEAGNRLWGCRYGNDGNGNFINEIYCSARGDFFRWIQGEATNEDAPVTFSVGTDGVWTGCINYGGYPTFFKENSMHRVSGYGASGFALQEAPCIGVQKGAERSLAVVNNVLYYKADHCIVAYDGSVPVNVSDKLGRLSVYNRAVGGACGGKYYVSMWVHRPDESGKAVSKNPVLYALDTEKGLWHKEDETECESMASYGDNLYFVEVRRSANKVEHKIKAVKIPVRDEYLGLELKETEKEPAMIPWYAETGIIGLESPDAKYVSRLAIRMHLDAGASVRVLVQYDSSGYWKQIAGTEAATMRTVTMPVVPARCDHMRLRLEGVGGCKVYSITKTVENGEEA